MISKSLCSHTSGLPPHLHFLAFGNLISQGWHLTGVRLRPLFCGPFPGRASFSEQVWGGSLRFLCCCHLATEWGSAICCCPRGKWNSHSWATESGEGLGRAEGRWSEVVRPDVMSVAEPGKQCCWTRYMVTSENAILQWDTPAL